MWKFNGKISLLIFEKNTMLKLEIVEDWIYCNANPNYLITQALS